MARRRKYKSKFFFKRLYRSAGTTQINGGTDVVIKAISVSPTGAENMTNTLNQASSVSNSTDPILIKSYHLRVNSNFNGVVYQCVGDNDDYTSGDMFDWDPQDPDFMAMFKRHKLISGGNSHGSAAPDLVVADDWHVNTLSYNGLIKLRTPAKPDGQTILWGIHNLTNDVRTFYADLIVKYCQLT